MAKPGHFDHAVGRCHYAISTRTGLVTRAYVDAPSAAVRDADALDREDASSANVPVTQPVDDARIPTDVSVLEVQVVEDGEIVAAAYLIKDGDNNLADEPILDKEQAIMESAKYSRTRGYP